MLRRLGLRRWGKTLWATILSMGVVVIGLAGVEGCRKPAPTSVDDSGFDPTDANMAPVSDVGPANGGVTYNNAPPPQSYGSARPQSAARPRGRVLGERQADIGQQTSEQYSDGTNAAGGYTQAPIERRSPEYSDQQPPYNAGYAPNGGVSEGSYDPSAYSNVTEVADQPPPPLPVYEQPPAPEPDDLWTPGYWNYAQAGYYWVPGVWVAAPYRGALWTPGYWSAYRGRYGYHPGFWGLHVGFYGGIAYGFGYYGSGYRGGYWNGDHFNYNRAVTNVNVTNIHNVYNRTVIVNNVTINNAVSNRYVDNVVNRGSYNGGLGGIQVRPGPAEVAALRTPRIAPMATQIAVQQSAAANRQQFYVANGGRPAVAAAPRPVVADRSIAAPAVPNAGEGMRPGMPAGTVGAAPAVQGSGAAGRGPDRFVSQHQQPLERGRVGQTVENQISRRPGTTGFVQGQGTRNGQPISPGQHELRAWQRQPVQPQIQTGQRQPAVQPQTGQQQPDQPQAQIQAAQSGRSLQGGTQQQPMRGAQRGQSLQQEEVDRTRGGQIQNRVSQPARDQTLPARNQPQPEGRGQQVQQGGGRGQAEMERQRPDTNAARPQTESPSRPTVQEAGPRTQSPPSTVRPAPPSSTPPRVQPESRPSGQPAREERARPQGERRSEPESRSSGPR